MSSSSDFEHVIETVGHRGRYQVVMFLLLCIPATIPVAFLTFSNVFTTATPDHWCRPSSVLRRYNVSDEVLKYVTVPHTIRQDGVKVYSNCDMYDENSEAYQKFIKSNSEFESIKWMEAFEEFANNNSIPIVGCKHGWQYDKTHYDNTLVTEMDLVCENNWFPQAATAVFYTGSIFGNIFFGWIGDRLGRRPTILWMIGFEVIVSIITAFSNGYEMYLVMRAIGGLVFPSMYQIPFILGVEMMAPRHRTLAGVMICTMFALSMSLLSLLAFLLRDWYKLSLAISIPFVSLIGYYWIIPESPRWLVSRGRMSDAEKVLQTIAKFNGTTVPKDILYKTHDSKAIPLLCPVESTVQNGRLRSQVEVQSDVAQDKYDTVKDKWTANSSEQNDLVYIEVNSGPLAVKEEARIVKSHQVDDGNADEVVQEATILDIFRYPNIRKKFFLLTYTWTANGVVYNGLSYNATNLGVNDFLAFFISAVIEIPSNLFACHLMNILGRRLVLCLAFTVGGLGCLCCMFIPEDLVWYTVGLAMIGKFGVSASFSVFYVFVSESFPTVIRSQAMGLGSLIACAGLLTFPYILHMGHFSKMAPMIILGIIALSAAFCSIFIPETLYKPMPQTLQDGENFGKHFNIFSFPRKPSNT